MHLGMVGLGRMGANLVRRLMKDGHHCVVFDVRPDTVHALAGEGATGAASVADLVAKLPRPRAVWVMVPAGEITQAAVDGLARHLEPDDVIIDGGNTSYRDDIARAAVVAERGIHYVDIGTSGGVWGVERGFCLMIGGEEEIVARLPPDLRLDRARCGGGRAHAGSAGGAGGCRAGLPALLPDGGGALRQDGPQRDRVRDHGLLRGGTEHPQERGRRLAAARGRRGERGAAGEPGVLPLPHRGRRGRGALAARQCDPVLVAGPAATALLRSADLAEFSGQVSDSGEGRWTTIAAVEEGCRPRP